MAEPDQREGDGGLTGVDGRTGEDFLAGMKVMVVDDDRTCLLVICQLLRKCGYNNVTHCREGKEALRILRENKGNFDLVISDVHMPDMDGFKLLEHVGLEMDLPVIMMSNDSSIETVKKAMVHGACNFIPKPVTREILKCIYQHVLRKNINNNDNNNENENKDDANASASRSVKKRKDVITGEDENDEEIGDDGFKKNVKKKAKRFHWVEAFHKQFLNAIDKLGGVNGAVPKKILGLMDVPGLTREHVASHLQKYRHFIQKTERAQQQEQLHNSQIMSTDQTMTSQYFPHQKPLNYYAYSKPSSLLPNQLHAQNSVNPHQFIANSTNIPLPILSLQQQQQQQHNLMINHYQSDLRNFQQFGNNISNPFCPSTSSVFISNNGEDVGGNNDNGSMGVIKAGHAQTRYGMDHGLESPTSNLTTYSNNCSETMNNNFGWYNGQI